MEIKVSGGSFICSRLRGRFVGVRVGSRGFSFNIYEESRGGERGLIRFLFFRASFSILVILVVIFFLVTYRVFIVTRNGTTGIV